MTDNLRITHDLDYAIDCFYPVLQSLQIKQEITGTPVFLSAFSQLKDFNAINKWTINVLKTTLPRETEAIFIPQYFEKSGIMNYFIILDASLFVNSKVSHELRKMITVHSFCHFLAFLFAGVGTTKNDFSEVLRERLSTKINSLSYDKVFKLYQSLNNMGPKDNFTGEDEHFRLGVENVQFSYTDLFKNFLFPRKMFEEYFSRESEEKFRDLFRAGSYQEAQDLFTGIAKKIAQEEWLPENFAINQAIDILGKFYINKLQ